MDHYKFPVFGHLGVGLEEFYAILDTSLKVLKRIFEAFEGSAAMGCDDKMVGIAEAGDEAVGSLFVEDLGEEEEEGFNRQEC